MIFTFTTRLRGGLRNLTIRKKLLASYFILIFIPLSLLTVVSYINVSKVSKNQILYSAGQSFDQAYAFLDYKVSSLIKSSDVIYFNTDVQTILMKNRDQYEGDMVDQNIDLLKLDKFLNSLKNTKDVYRASLYVPGWFSYANQDINFSNIDVFARTDAYQNLLMSKEKVVWLPPHLIQNNTPSLESMSVVSLLRKIRNSDQISEIIGVIQVSIQENSIKDIITKANITQEGVVYIQNAEGELISCSNLDHYERLALDEYIDLSARQDEVNWHTITVGGKNFAVTARSFKDTDWIIVTAIPFSEILAQSTSIKNYMLILMLIVGVIAYGVAYFISASTVRRITLLMRKMKNVQAGILDVEIESFSKDEVGQLTDNFNYMVKQISLLMEKQYETGKEIKNLELKALQAQINPHFLYNTLEMINWKAIDHGIPEIAVIAQSLAKFYKLSLNAGRDIVSLSDEINHIKTYVQIQNLRFDNRIILEIHLDENLYQYQILKLILQPIVENSIIHGTLENRKKRKGKIVIEGRLEKEDLLLTVQDDGKGMTIEKAESILLDSGTQESHGYGIRNINHRIRLCYGSQYGLAYESSPGQGTRVEIKIPAQYAD